MCSLPSIWAGLIFWQTTTESVQTSAPVRAGRVHFLFSHDCGGLAPPIYETRHSKDMNVHRRNQVPDLDRRKKRRSMAPCQNHEIKKRPVISSQDREDREIAGLLVQEHQSRPPYSLLRREFEWQPHLLAGLDNIDPHCLHRRPRLERMPA